MKLPSFLLIITITILSLISTAPSPCQAQPDNSEIAEASQHLEFLIPLFVYKGRPINENQDQRITILVNHGYMVSFSADRKQPLWAAYRVDFAVRSTNYKRPEFFHDDLRLHPNSRIGTDTFPGYDRGHMVPNFAINTQYGKLAQ